MVDITDRFKRYGDYLGETMKIMGSPAEDEKEPETEDNDVCIDCGRSLESPEEFRSGMCERCYALEQESGLDDYRHPDAKA